MYFDSVLFFTKKINNKSVLNEKKFIIVKLYGGKLNTNTPPSKKGDKNITKNLLSNKRFNLSP